MSQGRISKRSVDAICLPRRKGSRFPLGRRPGRLWRGGVPRWEEDLCRSIPGRRPLAPDQDRRSRALDAGRGAFTGEGDARRRGGRRRPDRRSSKGARGSHVPRGRRRFHASSRRAKRKGRTHGDYEALLRRFIFPAIGNTRVVDVRRSDSRSFTARCRTLPILPTALWRSSRAFGIGPLAAMRSPSLKILAKGIERNPENGRERYLTTEELGRLGDASRQAETTGLPWEVDEGRATAKLAKERAAEPSLTPSRLQPSGC